MKRLLSLLLVMLLLATTVLPLTAFAETKADSPYVTNGLVSWYSGTQNTRNGLSTDADTWEDLVGNNDMTVEKNDRNYFTKTGYHLDTARNLFPQGIVDVINGQEFTVEVLFDEFQAKAAACRSLHCPISPPADAPLQHPEHPGFPPGIPSSYPPPHLP